MAADTYYRDLLLQMLPPGAYNVEENGIIWSLASALGKIFAQAEGSVDTLELNVTPHRADECLAEWEALLDAPSGAGATDEQRQDAIVARWRMASGVRPFGIRSVLAPILNPTHQFRDTCDDSEVSWRYRGVAGGGSANEDTTRLQLAVAGASDARWDSSNKNQHMELLPILDLDRGAPQDSFAVEVLLSGDALGNSTAAGIVAYKDDNNAYLYGPHQDGAGGRLLGISRFVDNVYTALFSSAAVPAYPRWITLEYDGDAETWAIRHGASLSSLTTIDTFERHTFHPREIGVFIRNGTGLNAATLDIDTIQVRYGKQHNNVEMIETKVSLLSTANETNIFFYFIHRDPADIGTYDIEDAQRALDKIKSAHCMAYVGESDCFRCDDSYSLTDRDVLGQ